MTKTIPCNKCNGRGYFTVEQHGPDYAGVTVLRCEVCQGKGMIEAPVTNADHIRSMTDEELVYCMNALNFCPPNIDEGKVCGDSANCYRCWLDWLKQPYKEEV